MGDAGMSSKSATVAKGIIIAAIPVILIVLFFRGLFLLASFKVTGDLSEDAKVSMAEQALLPDIAEYVDRYGLRGFQDVDLQIEICVIRRDAPAPRSGGHGPWRGGFFPPGRRF